MMGRFAPCLLNVASLYLLIGAPAGAVPQIRSILNAASYSQPGMPNSGIARGSMFVVFGTDLGPAELQQAAGFPLRTSLGSTSIRVTVGATSVEALMVYVSSTQVAAILPSATPEGIGLAQVTSNGLTSQAGAFRIVRSAPGILTQNQAGTGRALAQNFNSSTDQPPNTLSNPAKAGQTVTLWGTGLGPVPDDEMMVPMPRNLDLNLQVLVGGKPAAVRYQGRSACCTGVDQIVFEVPAGVSGCSVPVVVQVDGAVSNFTAISVADPNGSECTDISGISGTMLEKLRAGGTIRVGAIVLGVSRGTFVQESGLAQFFVADLGWLASQVSLDLPVPGSCAAGPAASSTYGFTSPLVGLDAGQVLNVTGPKGSRQILQRWNGVYNEVFANGTLVQFLQPGTYTVDSAPGGADVGPFHATISYPAELASTVQQSATETTVNWTGGDSSGYVVVTGSAYSATGLRADFSCLERTSAGKFTLPAYLLASLPGSPSNVSALIAAGSSPQNRFQTQGLDIGYFSFCSPVSRLCNLTFQDWF